MAMQPAPIPREYIQNPLVEKLDKLANAIQSLAESNQRLVAALMTAEGTEGEAFAQTYMDGSSR